MVKVAAAEVTLPRRQLATGSAAEKQAVEQRSPGENRARIAMTQWLVSSLLTPNVETPGGLAAAAAMVPALTIA